MTEPTPQPKPQPTALDYASPQATQPIPRTAWASLICGVVWIPFTCGLGILSQGIIDSGLLDGRLGAALDGLFIALGLAAIICGRSARRSLRNLDRHVGKTMAALGIASGGLVLVLCAAAIVGKLSN
jgi:hypothetical protein